MTSMLVASRTAPSLGRVKLRLGRPGASFVDLKLFALFDFSISRRTTPDWRRPVPGRVRGFTLIELLVAIAAMALMAGLSWRGLDGMVRAQTQIQQRADSVLTLQAGLAQWSADLDALLTLPQTQTLDWDGRGLRIIRRSTATPGDGLLVVAWARRNVNGTDQWLRWQSPPQFTRGELQTAWGRAAQWAQNPGDEEKRYEVRIAALTQWQIFYFRDNGWSNPLSSDSTTPITGADKAVAGSNLALPDGVRLVLTLPPGEAISENLTLDWVRPALDRGKS